MQTRRYVGSSRCRTFPRTLSLPLLPSAVASASSPLLPKNDILPARSDRSEARGVTNATAERPRYRRQHPRIFVGPRGGIPGHRHRRRPVAVPLGALDVVPPLGLARDRRPTHRGARVVVVVVAPPSVEQGGDGLVDPVVVAVPIPPAVQHHLRQVGQRRRAAPQERAVAAAAAPPPVSSRCAASRSSSSSSAVRAAAVASDAAAARAVVVGGVRERRRGFEGVAGVVPARAGVVAAAAAAAVRHRRGEEADATTIARVAPRRLVLPHG